MLRKTINLKTSIFAIILFMVCLGFLLSPITANAYSPELRIDDCYRSTSRFYKLKVNRVRDTIYYTMPGDIETIHSLPEGTDPEEVVYNQGRKILKYIIVECEVVQELFHGDNITEVLLLPLTITVDETGTSSQTSTATITTKYLDFQSVKAFLESCDMLYYGTSRFSDNYTFFFYDENDGEIKTIQKLNAPYAYKYPAQLFPVIDGKIAIDEIDKCQFSYSGLSYGVEDYLYDGLTEAEADENIKRLYEDVLEYERLEAERIADAERKANRSFLEVIFDFVVGIIQSICEFFKNLFNLNK